jgi:hypothetical protein
MPDANAIRQARHDRCKQERCPRCGVTPGECCREPAKVVFFPSGWLFYRPRWGVYTLGGDKFVASRGHAEAKKFEDWQPKDPSDAVTQLGNIVR